jgi:hypothetical protein
MYCFFLVSGITFGRRRDGPNLIFAGVNWGGRTYAWSSPAVIAAIVIGISCGIVLGFWEAYADLKYPLLPPKMFKKFRE